MPRFCTFEEHRNGAQCGLKLLRGVSCAKHDRVRCSCGYRLVGGDEVACPDCGKDVRLATVMKGQG